MNYGFILFIFVIHFTLIGQDQDRPSYLSGLDGKNIQEKCDQLFSTTKETPTPLLELIKKELEQIQKEEFTTKIDKMFDRAFFKLSHYLLSTQSANDSTETQDPKQNPQNELLISTVLELMKAENGIALEKVDEILTKAQELPDSKMRLNHMDIKLIKAMLGQLQKVTIQEKVQQYFQKDNILQKALNDLTTQLQGKEQEKSLKAMENKIKYSYPHTKQKALQKFQEIMTKLDTTLELCQKSKEELNGLINENECLENQFMINYLDGTLAKDQALPLFYEQLQNAINPAPEQLENWKPDIESFLSPLVLKKCDIKEQIADEPQTQPTSDSKMFRGRCEAAFKDVNDSLLKETQKICQALDFSQCSLDSKCAWNLCLANPENKNDPQDDYRCFQRKDEKSCVSGSSEDQIQCQWGAVPKILAPSECYELNSDLMTPNLDKKIACTNKDELQKCQMNQKGCGIWRCHSPLPHHMENIETYFMRIVPENFIKIMNQYKNQARIHDMKCAMLDKDNCHAPQEMTITILDHEGEDYKLEKMLSKKFEGQQPMTSDNEYSKTKEIKHTFDCQYMRVHHNYSLNSIPKYTPFHPPKADQTTPEPDDSKQINKSKMILTLTFDGYDTDETWELFDHNNQKVEKTASFLPPHLKSESTEIEIPNDLYNKEQLDEFKLKKNQEGQTQEINLALCNHPESSPSQDQTPTSLDETTSDQAPSEEAALPNAEDEDGDEEEVDEDDEEKEDKNEKKDQPEQPFPMPTSPMQAQPFPTPEWPQYFT